MAIAQRSKAIFIYSRSIYFSYLIWELWKSRREMEDLKRRKLKIVTKICNQLLGSGLYHCIRKLPLCFLISFMDSYTHSLLFVSLFIQLFEFKIIYESASIWVTFRILISSSNISHTFTHVRRSNFIWKMLHIFSLLPQSILSLPFFFIFSSFITIADATLLLLIEC